MIKTTLFNATAIGAGTGGQLTPAELLLNGDTKKFAIEMSVVTTRVATPASRKEFTLCWATTPENLDPSSDNVPQILMECTHRTPMVLSELQSKQKKQIIERCVAGEYLYVWAEYPQSADAYAITIVAKEYAYSSSGGSSTSPEYTASVGFTSSASKTRPNDTNAYAALDVIAESTSAGTVWQFSNIAPSTGGEIVITAAALEIDVAAIPAGQGRFRLHLYSTSPTAINDNAAFNLIAADRAKYLGYIEFPEMNDLGDTLYSSLEESYFGIRKQITAASGTLYGILQTMSAYTPTAQAVKSINLHSVLA